MLKDAAVMFGQSGNKSMFSRRRFVRKRAIDELSITFGVSLTETLRLCAGTEALDSTVPTLEPDRDRSMVPIQC